jgi:hypothetical protein
MAFSPGVNEIKAQYGIENVYYDCIQAVQWRQAVPGGLSAPASGVTIDSACS